MKNNLISIAIGILISIPIMFFAIREWNIPETDQKEIDFSKYIEESNVEEEVLGVEPDTDFIPGHYQEEINPYPESQRLDIEATAYCHGEVTYTGKNVREGYAAMSKEYIGKTAIVYTRDENGNPLDYIGIYEIEDTGSDYRIEKGDCIDLYINDYEKAIEFGRQDVVVYLIDAKG